MSDYPPPKDSEGSPPSVEPLPPSPGGQWAAPAPAPTAALTTDAFGRPLSAWWKRLVAIIIDGFVVSIPTGIVLSILFGFGRDDIATNLLSFLAAFAYKMFMEARPSGQTVGKMALRIQVRDATTGGPLEMNKSLVRSLVYVALFIPCGIPGIINGLSPLWDKKRQSWHDKAANTVVVDLTS